MNLDFYLFQNINGLASRYCWLDSLGIFFADYFGYILAAFLFVFLIKDFKKYRIMVFLALASGVLAKFGFTELIRFFWDRPRPFIENNINLLLDNLNQPAFPSGHTAFFFALSALVFLYGKKESSESKFLQNIGLYFFACSFLIGLARVFTGVHWPLDILGGALVGIFSAWLILKIFKKHFT